MEIKIFNSITEINEQEWDEIVGKDQYICTHRFLVAVEKSEINDCQYFYIVIFENNKMLAHTTVYSIRTELDTFAKGMVKKIVSMVRARWKNFLMFKSLECGTPVELGNTFSFRDNVDRIGILRLMTQSIEDLAKKNKIHILLIRDFYHNELSLFDYFKNMGYKRIHNLPTTSMDIKWKTYDEYLKSIRSEYRFNIRKKMKNFNESGVQVQLVKDFSPFAGVFEKLWRNTYDNAREYRREILTKTFFLNMNRFLQGQCEALIFTKNDSIIAFNLLIYNDKTLVMFFCGLDYELIKDNNAYFNLLYKIIELGIIKKMKKIDFGITTLEPKKRVGAEVVPLFMYMKHLNPFLNSFVPKIFDLFTPSFDGKSRNVFKKDITHN